MGEEIKFTPEQLEHINNLIAEKQKGLFTKEDLDKEVSKEVDRRVESGIQKGLDTHKSKWQKEFEEQSKLSAEELAEKKLESKMEEIKTKENELSLKENTLEAKSMLANAGISKEHSEKFIGILVSGDKEETKTNVENFISTFSETKADIEKSIKNEYANVPSVEKGGSDGNVDKTELSKMTYLEIKELKENNKALYDRLFEN